MTALEKRRKFLDAHHDTMARLYPGYTGKYYLNKHRKMRRYMVQLMGVKCTSYARLKVEILKGKVLPPHVDVDHINDNTLDDRRNNLQVLTKRDNILKGYATGAISAEALVRYNKSEEGRQAKSLRHRAEKNALARFNNKTVFKLRTQFAKGKITKEEIMQAYNVDHSTTYFMLTGRTYASVGGPLWKPKKFNVEIAYEMHVVKGYPIDRVIKKTGMSKQQVVNAIRYYRTKYGT